MNFQVRPCPKPTKIKLDMKTNMETKIVTKHYLPETGLSRDFNMNPKNLFDF